MNRHRSTNRRSAFTLVELMVAMALIIFIMYVLAEAFSAGAGAFRTLKAVGDMNERLRGVTTLLRNHLSAPHFDGTKRLSDRDFWRDGPPKEGFFRIWQDNAGSGEGYDLDSNPSVRSTTHHLHFTVKLPGKGKDQFFRAEVPSGSTLLTVGDPVSRFQDPTGNVFVSPYAEVAFYLVATGENTEDPTVTGGTSLPLHTLFMRQRLINPTGTAVSDTTNASNQYLEISHTSTSTTTPPTAFNQMADVAIPANRFGASNNLSAVTPPSSYQTFQSERGATDPAAGSDVLLTDVLSFDVRVLLGEEAYGANPQTFRTLFDTEVMNFEMHNASTLPSPFGTAKVFDTWTANRTGTNLYPFWNVRHDDTNKPSGFDNTKAGQVIPLYRTSSGQTIRIRAIQVTIRIWDSKTKQSRQTSVVVAL